MEPDGSTGSTTDGFSIDWRKFDGYLTNAFHLRTQSEYRGNAKRYWRVLTTGDASPLLGLSDSKRRHAMAALAALANFTGSKEYWKGIVSRHNLKWNGRNDMGDLVGLLYANRFDDMVRELRASLEVVPEDYANHFRFNLLVGLRPSESVEAVNMLRTTPSYLNKEVGVLEHFRYPQQFLRNTKKAFLSVVDTDTLEIAKRARSLDYQGLRSEFRRRKAAFAMRFCRKLWATYMRKHVDTELVDLLQGRVPTSIFAKYYNRPNYLDELEKVRSCLPDLRKLLGN
jgi:integrase-like protein